MDARSRVSVHTWQRSVIWTEYELDVKSVLTRRGGAERIGVVSGRTCHAVFRGKDIVGVEVFWQMTCVFSSSRRTDTDKSHQTYSIQGVQLRITLLFLNSGTSYRHIKVRNMTELSSFSTNGPLGCEYS